MEMRSSAHCKPICTKNQYIPVSLRWHRTAFTLCLFAQQIRRCLIASVDSVLLLRMLCALFLCLLFYFFIVRISVKICGRFPARKKRVRTLKHSFIHSFILFQTTEVHRHTHNTYIYRRKNTHRETERKRQNTLTKHAVQCHYHRLTACWQNLL